MVKPIYCDGSIELTRLVEKELQKREADILSADKDADKILTCDEYVLWHGGDRKYRANFKKLRSIAARTREQALKTIGWKAGGKSGNKVLSDDGDRLSGKIDEAMKGADQQVQSQSGSPFDTKVIDGAGKTIYPSGEINSPLQVEVKGGTIPLGRPRKQTYVQSGIQKETAEQLYKNIERIAEAVDSLLTKYGGNYLCNQFQKELSNDFIKPLKKLRTEANDLLHSSKLSKSQYKHIDSIISDILAYLKRYQVKTT